MPQEDSCMQVSLPTELLFFEKRKKKLWSGNQYFIHSSSSMRKHRGAQNLHSSPLLMHCCVMLRPNWNVGDYFMFHGTKGLKTIKKIIFSSLLVVLARSFTMWGRTLGGWRQVVNKLAAFCDGPSAWSIGCWRSCTCSWAPAIIKNLLKLFLFCKTFYGRSESFGAENSKV